MNPQEELERGSAQALEAVATLFSFAGGLSSILSVITIKVVEHGGLAFHQVVSLAAWWVLELIVLVILV